MASSRNRAHGSEDVTAPNGFLLFGALLVTLFWGPASLRAQEDFSTRAPVDSLVIGGRPEAGASAWSIKVQTNPYF